MSLQQSKLSYNPGHYVEHFYLCNYRPRHIGGDRLSRSILRFKDALAHDLRAWIDCAVSELQKVDIADDIIVMRALSSTETIIDASSDTALDKLGKAIAEKFAINWMPGLINMLKITRPLKSLEAAERSTEIKNAYSLFSENLDLNDKRLLLIDDIISTGTTITTIIRLIKQHFPRSRFKVFTLAKSDYDSSLNASLYLAGATYAWEENSGWMVAEEEPVYNRYSYAQLSNFILKDDFS